ncbi:MAG: rhomboid family intramembrane serine protease [Candidatus Manganitrophaceae bacterium]
MIPLRDDLPTRSVAVVTAGLIVANVLLFFYELSLGPKVNDFVLTFGAIPANLAHGLVGGKPALLAASSVFTSMFLHGGWMHLVGNMLYLWIFGNNIEDATGHLRFIFFYLLCGFVAAYTHALTNVASHVPMVGASGAISGVLGAYLLLYPHAKILTLVPIGFFIQVIQIPAVLVLGFWFFVQFLNAILGLGEVGGIAWFAHIGGFLAGMVLIYPFKKKGRKRRGR